MSSKNDQNVIGTTKKIVTYKKGFRMMTMGWTDGSSFVPIASSLLSSRKPYQKQ
uniref:hypothetical protein n=1 Tax=Lactobacillus delbrueckii TaxID=1584 RepID=UPI00398B85B3